MVKKKKPLLLVTEPNETLIPAGWHCIPFKPLSANQMWYGHKHEQAYYREYKDELKALLPTLEIPSGKLRVQVLVAHSSPLFDLDNAFKPLFDGLQKACPSFNDRDIHEIRARKIRVPKGCEFTAFAFQSLQQ